MKKVLFILVILGAVCFASFSVVANSPWPIPGTETNVTTTSAK